MIKKLKDILLIGIGIIALLFFCLLLKAPDLLQSILYFFGISYTVSYYIINAIIVILGGTVILYFIAMLLVFIFRYYERRILQAQAENLLEK